MSAPGDYQVDIWHKTGTTWGVLSYSISLAQVSRFMTYEWTFTENKPKGLKITLSNGDLGTYNLLDPTFNAWSNGVVGAVDNGDMVAFAICPVGRTDLPYIFYGVVDDVQPDVTNRTLTLVCNDLMQRYEGIKSDKIVFNSYQDKLLTNYALTTQANWYALTDITDPNIALPFVDVEFSADDATISTYTTSPGANTVMTAPVAQAFVMDASSNAILGVRLYVSNSGTAGNISVQLCPDDGNGNPATGTTLAAAVLSVPSNHTGWVTGAFGINNGPVPVNPGQVYWMVFGYALLTGAEYYGYDATNPYSVWPNYSIYIGSAWTVQSNISLTMIVDTTKYTTISWDKCVWTPSTGQLFIAVSGSLVKQQSYANPYRGRVSYYYGVVPVQLIMAALTGLDAPLGYDTPQALAIPPSGDYFMSKTFPLFRTKGNFVADCMREICDNFCCYYNSAYYQAALAPYNIINAPSGTNYLRWSRRLVAGTDAAFRTLSTAVGATDDYMRITDASGLRKTAKRPASVMVVGQDSSGLPIVAHRDDYLNDMHSAGTSFRNKTKLLLTTTVTDTSVNTLQQAHEIAQSTLDMIVRDSWEGEVKCSGCMPDLCDIDTTSSTYGSGKIINLIIPEAGITTGTPFKVRGIVMTPFETDIQLTNNSFLAANNFTAAYLSAKKSESFIAPTDVATNAFMKLTTQQSVKAWSDNNLQPYMEIETDGGVPLPSSQRMLCTQLKDSTRHTVIYHAEFEEGNGLSSSSSNWVKGASLFLNMTGGSAGAVASVGASYTFPKWSGTRVIVDFACWDGT